MALTLIGLICFIFKKYRYEIYLGCRDSCGSSSSKGKHIISGVDRGFFKKGGEVRIKNAYLAVVLQKLRELEPPGIAYEHQTTKLHNYSYTFRSSRTKNTEQLALCVSPDVLFANRWFDLATTMSRLHDLTW